MVSGTERRVNFPGVRQFVIVVTESDAEYMRGMNPMQDET